jgi:glycosyltransferase involved in cell wall biosynthesis
VLWVGSLRAYDRRKDLDTLVDAMATDACRSATLVMAGAAGAESDRLRALAASRRVKIIVTGYVPDLTLAALYRAAAVVVVPSLHEGFGLPVLEAMACGAPIVAAGGGNTTDLVGGAGVVVDAGNATGLGNAIGAVLGDVALRDRLAASGPRQAAPFTWERAADLTAAVYEAALTRA